MNVGVVPNRLEPCTIAEVMTVRLGVHPIKDKNMEGKLTRRESCLENMWCPKGYAGRVRCLPL